MTGFWHWSKRRCRYWVSIECRAKASTGIQRWEEKLFLWRDIFGRHFRLYMQVYMNFRYSALMAAMVACYIKGLMAIKICRIREFCNWLKQWELSPWSRSNNLEWLINFLANRTFASVNMSSSRADFFNASRTNASRTTLRTHSMYIYINIWEHLEEERKAWSYVILAVV